MEILTGARVPESPDLAAPKRREVRAETAPVIAEWLDKPLSESERSSLLHSQTASVAKARRKKSEIPKKKNSKKVRAEEEKKENSEKNNFSTAEISAPQSCVDFYDGQSQSIYGSKGDIYIIERRGDNYTCTCPAFKFRPGKLPTKTCKHIQQIRGVEAELIRTSRAENQQ